MKRRAVAVTAAAALLGLASAPAGLGARQAVPVRAMALTFDDLPYAYVGPGADAVTTARRAAASLLEVLAAHHAPAVAFVNEGKLGTGPDRDALVEVLRVWADAGVVLGDHTFSHADFNTRTVEQFEDEILKGDVVSRGLMQRHEPYTRYFRHPETHTGDTLAKKQAIEAFLAQHDYRIAPHTIETADYIFNVGFVHARGSDPATAARLRAAYLDFAARAADFAERVTPRIFGRAIPQTLLLHANDINADALDDLLRALEGRGYTFVSLDAAMADPAYRTPDTLVTRSGPTWLWRWTKSLGLDVSFREDPDPPQWVVDLYNKER